MRHKAVCDVRIGYVLRNINDRSTLNCSSLARLAYVERLARERYNGHLLPRGLALRELLTTCVEKISRDLGSNPALYRECQYLVLLKDGLSCQQISNELGLSREHVSRIYRKKALELLAEEFLSTIRNHK